MELNLKAIGDPDNLSDLVRKFFHAPEELDHQKMMAIQSKTQSGYAFYHNAADEAMRIINEAYGYDVEFYNLNTRSSQPDEWVCQITTRRTGFHLYVGAVKTCTTSYEAFLMTMREAHYRLWDLPQALRERPDRYSAGEMNDRVNHESTRNL